MLKNVTIFKCRVFSLIAMFGVIGFYGLQSNVFAQSGMNIVISMDKPSYVVGEQPIYRISGPPNAPIYWSSWKNGTSTGEVNGYYGQTTDNNGHADLQGGAWVAAHTGAWKKQISIELL